jgi:hypothetical protein
MIEAGDKRSKVGLGLQEAGRVVGGSLYRASARPDSWQASSAQSAAYIPIQHRWSILSLPSFPNQIVPRLPCHLNLEVFLEDQIYMRRETFPRHWCILYP